MRKTSLLALALLLLANAGSATQTPLKRVNFLTNYVFHGRHAPFFVGMDKGFYREVGLEVSISPSTGSGFVLSALEGGKADFGIAEAAPLVQAVAKGARVKAFGVFMDVTTSGLASLTPYPTPESLLGKTLAASLTDSARVILPIIFREKGLDPSRLEWVSVDPSVYFPLLLGGRVDLVTASIDGDVPALKRVAEPRGKTVHFSSFAEWGYDVFGYFLVTRADLAASRPEDVRAFAAGTVKAVQYALERPEETAQIMVRYNPTLDVGLTLAHWRESMKAIDTPYVRKNGYGVATPERLARTIALVKRAFNLDAALTPADVYALGLISP